MTSSRGMCLFMASDFGVALLQCANLCLLLCRQAVRPFFVLSGCFFGFFRLFFGVGGYLFAITFLFRGWRSLSGVGWGRSDRRLTILRRFAGTAILIGRGTEQRLCPIFRRLALTEGRAAVVRRFIALLQGCDRIGAQWGGECRCLGCRNGSRFLTAPLNGRCGFDRVDIQARLCRAAKCGALNSRQNGRSDGIQLHGLVF